MLEPTLKITDNVELTESDLALISEALKALPSTITNAFALTEVTSMVVTAILPESAQKDAKARLDKKRVEAEKKAAEKADEVTLVLSKIIMMKKLCQ